MHYTNEEKGPAIEKHPGALLVGWEPVGEGDQQRGGHRRQHGHGYTQPLLTLGCVRGDTADVLAAHLKELLNYRGIRAGSALMPRKEGSLRPNLHIVRPVRLKG